MSVRMRVTASTAHSATAMTSTSTVMGRRKAVRISHMRVSPRPCLLAARAREI